MNKEKIIEIGKKIVIYTSLLEMFDADGQEELKALQIESLSHLDAQNFDELLATEAVGIEAALLTYAKLTIKEIAEFIKLNNETKTH